jgi:hypothetical protein
MNKHRVLQILSYVFLFTALGVAPFCVPAGIALSVPQCNSTASHSTWPPYDHDRNCINIITSTLQEILIVLIVITFSCLLIGIIFRVLMKYCCKQVVETFVIESPNETSPMFFDPSYYTSPKYDINFAQNTQYQQSSQYDRNEYHLPPTLQPPIVQSSILQPPQYSRAPSEYYQSPHTMLQPQITRNENDVENNMSANDRNVNTSFSGTPTPSHGRFWYA